MLVVGVVLVRCASGQRQWRKPRTGPTARTHAPRVPHAGPTKPQGPFSSNPNVALGVPVDRDPSDDILLDEHQYVVSYNPKRLDPNWSAWRLDRSDFGHIRRRDNFRPDHSLPAGIYQVTTHDYSHSGYDRGHLCPSADRDATRDMNSLTFLMTNMVPQLHELNAGPWEKLEAHERELARRSGAEVYIVAGPVFGPAPKRIGRHGIAVPRATWKIIVPLQAGQTARDVTDSTQVIAVIMPNTRGVGRHAWTDYLTSVDEIEKETGYDFLDRVPEQVQRVIEARVR